jgi:hypothetical protein
MNYEMVQTGLKKFLQKKKREKPSFPSLLMEALSSEAIEVITWHLTLGEGFRLLLCGSHILSSKTLNTMKGVSNFSI